MQDIDGPVRAEGWDKHGAIVHTYDFVRGDPIGTVASWLRDAECLLSAEGRVGDVQRLDRIVSEFTDQSLSRVLKISLSDFAPPLDDPDDPAGFDPVFAREGFHVLVGVLCEEAAAWAEHARRQSEDRKRLPAEAVTPLLAQEFWTREQLAEFRGVKPESISKEVSEYRAKNGGRDPLWVRRLPGKQRGFRIKWPVYQHLLNRAHVRAGSRHTDQEPNP